MKILKNEKLSDKIVEKIIMMIENKEIEAGKKIPGEIALSKEFGVSRGILREAFNTLESKGYITRKNGDGTYINEKVKTTEMIYKALKNAEYIELFEAREAIEQKMIELIIEKSSDQEILELEEEVKLEKIQKSRNTNFHLKLAELSKNKIFYNFILVYYDLIAEIGEKTYHKEGRCSEVSNEHDDIVRLIKNRDKEGAKKLICSHFESVKNIIREELE